MGRLTKYRSIPDQSYDPRITDLSRPLNVPGATGPQSGIPYVDPGTGLATNGGLAAVAAGVLAPPSSQGWQNKNVTNQIPFLLVAGISIRALAYNAKRCGLLIQNLDATNVINYSFSNDLQGLGFQIAAGGAVLLDFTTPPDTLYLFSGTANVQAMVAEISRSGS